MISMTYPVEVIFVSVSTSLLISIVLAGVNHGLLLALLGQGNYRRGRSRELHPSHQGGHAGVQEHHGVHTGETSASLSTYR